MAKWFGGAFRANSASLAREQSFRSVLFDETAPAANGEAALLLSYGPDYTAQTLEQIGLASSTEMYWSGCGCSSCSRFTGDAELGAVDGVGDGGGKPPIAPVAIVTTDDPANNDTGTTSTLAVGDPAIVSTIESPGDKDFYAIQLVAGQTYEIGMYLTTEGPNGAGVADSFLELYDADGKKVSEEDGRGPNTPQGLDALMAFKAEYTGTYYVAATSYDQTGDGKGDSVGDYEIFAREASQEVYAYKSYYDFDSPLHSLDWGTQIDGTSRNPDGDQGPRDNGEAFTGHAWNPYGITGKNVVTYYVAKVGDVFVEEDPTSVGLTNTIVQGRTITDWERQAFRQAFDEYEEVADVIYIEVEDRFEADFKIITYSGTNGTASPSVLGRMSPPDTDSEGQTEFNAGDRRYYEGNVDQGAFFFRTFLHEFGHGHGMAHPHDDGGRSSIMRGAGSGTGEIGGGTGEFGLSQGPFTVMSYNSGWVDRPAGHGQASQDAGYGWVGALMPLDIAVIQDKYGVNEDHNKTDTVYTLKDVNAKGTFYDSIWDAGGNDTIVYSGLRETNIDLRAATLKYEEGGAGRVSYALGIHGGYTIANGAVIENAVGGDGADRLVGNEVANSLIGNAGADKLYGQEGDDWLVGGAGADALIGDAGADQAFGGDDEDWMVGGDGNDALIGEAGNDQLFGGEGGDWMVGGLGDDAVIGEAGDDQMFGDDGADWLDAGGGMDALVAGAGNDHLFGREGDDWLVGGAGSDILSGEAGVDRFVFESLGDSGAAGLDRIVDFNGAEDLIDLSQLDANSGVDGDQGFVFAGALAAGQAGLATRSYDLSTDTTTVSLDSDGDGVADMTFLLTGDHSSGTQGWIL